MRHNGEWVSDEENDVNDVNEMQMDKIDEVAQETLVGVEEVMIEVREDGKTNFKLSDGFKEKVWKPWKQSLIVKLLGKKLSISFMKRRLENMWERDRKIHVTAIENEFFLVRSKRKFDMEYALTAGPWIIFDHYLAVGDWLGKFIRLDNETTNLATGKFARICLELDLSQPLKAEHMIEGRYKKVEYEGLHLICYTCGKYGHKSETYTSRISSYVDKDVMGENPCREIVMVNDQTIIDQEEGKKGRNVQGKRYEGLQKQRDDIYKSEQANLGFDTKEGNHSTENLSQENKEGIRQLTLGSQVVSLDANKEKRKVSHDKVKLINMENAFKLMSDNLIKNEVYEDMKSNDETTILKKIHSVAKSNLDRQPS
ncbi:uncharacterized protein LOC133316952 [Gastrolobium bilobum]|uniref:uncharacterized protein LOC133316952 n=1 Tax=Gastrolobium bilobum TaxID=150636 RepID=UPI002AB10C34|nr:uncharacterized protein LOC133316952 [Gastrolobium bilobum]